MSKSCSEVLLVLALALVGCDEGRCVRNSDCPLGEACAVGVCVVSGEGGVPEAGVDGGDDPLDAGAALDAGPVATDGGPGMDGGVGPADAGDADDGGTGADGGDLDAGPSVDAGLPVDGGSPDAGLAVDAGASDAGP